MYYTSDMPWLFIPFSEEDLRSDLVRRYEVSSLPSLILIDKKCNLLKKNCKGDVEELEADDCIDEWVRLSRA